MKRIVLIVCVLCAAGCVQLSGLLPAKPTEQTATADHAPTTTPTPAYADNEVISNNLAWVKQMVQLYEDNAVAFNKEYVGKYYQITGAVTDISEYGIVIDNMNEMNFYYVKYFNPREYMPEAKMKEEMAEIVASLKKGDTVTVIVQFKGVVWSTRGYDRALSLSIYEINKR
jgi:flagellar basal body L-ring protein FlgH